MFNLKILREPKLHNLGMLGNDSKVRMKQGLCPQKISNDCICKDFDQSKEPYLCGTCCCRELLYPFPEVKLVYDQNFYKQKYPVRSESNVIPSLAERKEYALRLNQKAGNVFRQSGECCYCNVYLKPTFGQIRAMQNTEKGGEMDKCCRCARYVRPI
jgi:hypothetical protein